MKKISLPKQRSMYRSYKEARLGEEDLYRSMIMQGTYGRGDVYSDYMGAWNDILKFVDGMEDVVVLEAEREREEYMLRFENVSGR